MLLRTVPKHITSNLKEKLLSSWYGFTIDGSSDKDDKFLPVLVRRCVDKDSGLIATSLLNMPNIFLHSTINV